MISDVGSLIGTFFGILIIGVLNIVNPIDFKANVDVVTMANKASFYKRLISLNYIN